MIDLRAHGYSGGARFLYSIEEMHTDIISLIKESERVDFDLPMFLLGHSMGGGLVSSLFINNPYLQVHGVILSAPLLGLPALVPNDPLRLYVLNKIANETKDIVTHAAINPTTLTKVDTEIVKMINDGKNRPLATPLTMKSLVKQCSRILENCRSFNLPCLVIHGNKDKICLLHHSRIFIDNIKR